MTRINKHLYSDRQSFDRLILLIIAIIKYPGLGYIELNQSEDFETNQHDPMLEIKTAMITLANLYMIEFPPNYPSIPTIRKDLDFLKKANILDSRTYRWGYYFGTGLMSKSEFKIVFDLIKSQANNQKDPKIIELYQVLSKRLTGFELESTIDFFYPVRDNLNRAVNYTNQSENNHKNYQQTLCEKMPELELAIIQGQAIEIYRVADPYQTQKIGHLAIYPLQLIYHNTAWYLVYETLEDNCLVIGRINRYKSYFRIIKEKQRSLEQQRISLSNAQTLLKNGWGLKLGNKTEQTLELNKKLPLVDIKVRFYHPGAYFIYEAVLRHPKQKITLPPQTDQSKNLNSLEWVDYQIKLPERSLNEFLIWVQKYHHNAEIIYPLELAQTHYQNALKLVQRYTHRTDLSHS